MELLFKNEISPFPTELSHIEKRVGQIDPVKYGRTRNFIDGSVTYLSPYISRGVISTQKVLQDVLNRGFPPHKIEKFIQELAWRDYWQQVWISKKEGINKDLKQQQPDVEKYGLPDAILEGKTGIKAIDSAISDFYTTGYLHNHVRMYVASIACNLARCHWLEPAQWMYYHLLDADWASNALSWQWVAGANSRKKYFANQDNINKYCYTQQKNTFLDVPYERFSNLKVPDVLGRVSTTKLKTILPDKEKPIMDPDLPTLIYNFYNLDPFWKQGLRANRVLLLEPSHFDNYPVSAKSIQFAIRLSSNIPGIKVFVGEFDELIKTYGLKSPYFKEHPLSDHYLGNQESRDWMFPVEGYYPTFFAYWKRCKRQLGLK